MLRLASVVAHRRYAQERVDDAAVAAHVALLDLVAVASAGENLVEAMPTEADIFGVRELAEMAAEQIFDAVAEHLCEAFVDPQAMALGGDDRLSDHRRAERAGEHPLAPAELALDPGQLTEVGHLGDHADDLAVPEVRQIGDPHPPAIGLELQLELRRLSGERLLDRRLDLL